MASELKQLIVKELTGQFTGIDRCVVVNLTGLSARAAREIRADLRKQGITLSVVRNSLALRALSQVGLEKLGTLLNGPSAIAQGGEDLAALTRVVTDWSRKNDKIAIRGGFGDGAILAREDVLRISRLPGKSQMRAMLLAQMQSPLTGMMGVMNGVMRKFLAALSAVQDKQAGKQSNPNGISLG